MKKETVVKPVVHFTNGAAIVGAGNDKTLARVYGVLDHPHLGQEAIVITSLVQEVTKNVEGDIVLIETMNTIYKRVKPGEMQ